VPRRALDVCVCESRHGPRRRDERRVSALAMVSPPRQAAAAAGLLLLLLACIPANGHPDSQEGERCSVYTARCLTNSPRLIKVQHSPQSESYSYFYQVPRRVRKLVRRKIIHQNATETTTTRTTTPPANSDAGHDDAERRALFDHIQLTPVFGRRLSARRRHVATTTERTVEPEVVRTEATEAEISPNTLEAERTAFRRQRPSRRRSRWRRPAAVRDDDAGDDAAADDAALLEQATALEAATRHGTPRQSARAYRVNRLKRRRRILAKKIIQKTFNDATAAAPARKVLKVVAVRKPPKVVPGLSEVYHDNLINSLISEEYPGLQPSPGIKGFPGVDYPIYRKIPETTFSCSHQRYWGMYADTETQCQVWHYCDQDGHKHSFLCPNGTVFSQVTFICDWWFNVDCNNAVQLYVTNEALSLLPAPPEKTFPEDFKGPIVDWYIYQRHQERAYRKEKFLKQLEAGKQQQAIKFLETHDFPPWFNARDQQLYLKLKAIERKSKHHVKQKVKNRPVKKELTQYAPAW